ncbi:MAG: hypothetical protein K0S43_2466, partial [Cellulosimicrobium sp.]|nr:hypothetical protein [Cellulosimicrobium sp.]
MSVELAVRRARRAPRLRPGRIALVALVSGALALGAVQPSFAGEAPSQGTESPRIEGFGLGDGLEGLIDPRDGAVRLTIPVAGLSLTWDSRLVGSARDGLPHGWGWGFGRVRTDGSVRMSTASGEWLDLSEEWTSGLAGYDLADRTFRREPGTLPPRADGVLVDDDAASREVEFVLRELAGTTTYYGPTGDPLAQVSATGERLDWAWSAGDEPRLLGVVSADGVVTRLDWSTGKVEIGVAAGHAEGDAASPWAIRFDADGVRSVTDPEQGIVHVRSDVGGLVSELEGVTGATTSFTWRSAPADGVPGVAELATTDRDGARLSTRTWSALDGASASGWPVTDPLVGMVGSGGHRTVLSDGASSVTSTYDARQRLTERAVDVSTASGTQRIQEHAFEYEDRSALRPGVSPRDVAARPTRSEVTFRDAGGATRTVTEEFRFDAFGRVVSRTAADGTTSTVKYDDEQPDPHVPPMGLPLEHRVVAPDGSTTLTVAALTPNRTATAATERYAGPSEDELESTGRTEFEVREDGFVTKQRQLPAGGEPALVTRWSETTDLARGEVTVTETVGVGTDAESSSSHTTSVVHGGLVRQTDPLGNAVTHAFDGIGRQISSTDAIGRTVHVEYETAQRDGRNAVTTTAPDGVAVTQVSDVLGRVTEVTDNIRDGKTADGHARLIESRDYREPGVVRVIDAWGATTVAREDALGRPVEAIGPNGAVLRTAYDDVADTVTSGLTPTGSLADAEFVTTQVRDASGRVAEQTSERADDVPGPSMTTEFDGFGRPTTTRSAGAETVVRYDELGNPVTTTVTPTDGERADGTTRGAPVVAERRFDPFGASLEKTLSDGTTSRSGGSRTL